MDKPQSTQVGLGTVTAFPGVPDGHHLAPVAIGAPGPEQKIVFVPDPDFCTTNHLSAWVHFLEDLDHTGEEHVAHIPSFFNGEKPVYSLSVAVGSDPMSNDPQMRAAHVIIGDEGSVDAYQTPDMAARTAADLRRLADEIDEAARTARLHNEANAEVAA